MSNDLFGEIKELRRDLETLTRIVREYVRGFEELKQQQHSPEASFPCGCMLPSDCVYDGGVGILTYGVHCKRQPMARGAASQYAGAEENVRR